MLRFRRTSPATRMALWLRLGQTTSIASFRLPSLSRHATNSSRAYSESAAIDIQVNSDLVNNFRQSDTFDVWSKQANSKPLFTKILIANRGEVACRIIKTAKKLGIRTAAIYSDADRSSRHVKLADEAYRAGPAQSTQSYLDMDKIVQLCLQSGAQAVHPGWGFLSERAEFAEKLKKAGITFIGPPSSAIISMGSKSESKEIMIKAGVPCVPGYHGANQDPKLLKREAEKIGYPVLIKAIKGGGGKGMKIVYEPSEFENQLESAIREGEQSFGDGTVLLEKYLLNPRHVEVQVFGDTQGNYIHLNERDCSVQRRHQKIIEEAPAPGLSLQLRSELGEKAVAAAQAVNYVGAGTVEFILDSNERFYYMEMNTRLQVEHPITEMITGQDLVQWQLEIASGNRIPLIQNQVPCMGHAFEARIYAENPRRNFLPDVGTLIHVKTPQENESVRVETGAGNGDEISVYYDPMIAKLVVHSPKDRLSALRLLRQKLQEYQIVGPSTNIEFLTRLSAHPAFVAGQVETGFIEKHRKELFPPLPAEPSKEALVNAGVCNALEEISSRNSRGMNGHAQSPWDALHAWRLGGTGVSRQYEYGIVPDDPSHAAAQPSSVVVRISAHDPSSLIVNFEVRISGAEDQSTHQVHASLPGSGTPESASTSSAGCQVTSIIDGRRTVTTHVRQSLKQSKTFSDKHHVFGEEGVSELGVPWPKWLSASSSVEDTRASDGHTIRAVMPSKVIKVMVKVDDQVKVGDGLIVLEAMKTEVVLRASSDGVVADVKAQVGGMVSEGQVLIVLRPS